MSGAALWVIGALVVAVVAALGSRALRRRGRPERRRRPTIDPFTLSEPWRRHVSAAQSSVRRFDETLRTAAAGPLRDRLDEIGGRLRHGLDECWQIAQQGDQIDEALRRLDAPAVSARLSHLDASATPDSPTDEATRQSLRNQLAAAERLRASSEDTAARLRLTQVRLDELVALAAEVAAATSDVEALDTGVAELVNELEALRQAVDETGRLAAGGTT